MKRILKWLAIIVVVLAIAGFGAFLYLIPPFTLVKPQEFSDPVAKAGPNLSSISDPAERMIAERGRYLVTIGACSDCHTTPGAQGPRLTDMYLAGGFKMTWRDQGTYISMNLTSDKQTGIGSWTNDDFKRAVRNGIAPDGRPIPGHLMPWPAYSNWSDEDLYAVAVYLRHTAPIVHPIPKPAAAPLTNPAAIEEDYGGADYAAPADSGGNRR